VAVCVFDGWGFAEFGACDFGQVSGLVVGVVCSEPGPELRIVGPPSPSDNTTPSFSGTAGGECGR
jgi:hypothetical protein